MDCKIAKMLEIHKKHVLSLSLSCELVLSGGVTHASLEIFPEHDIEKKIRACLSAHFMVKGFLIKKIYLKNYDN